ncbi:MAG: DUF255 domain-containing protein [Dehalococcoidia bacterium]
MAKATNEFHFSPRPNRANEIQWRPWGQQPFKEAEESGKPILLALSAVWCHWCHVMDETSYSDPRIISYINENYVPVRVDNDQRPDINTRYNMGGWPTTAFLTAEGEVLTGGTYVPPDKMWELLPQISSYYAENRADVTRKIEQSRKDQSAAAPAAPGDLSPDIFDNVLRSAVQNYDPEYGGFGGAPKFPHSDVLDLLLYGHRRGDNTEFLAMAGKTLESMAYGGVFDDQWGGFFRYATNRDWSVPHYEKMLEDNANLLSSLLALYRSSHDEAHADIARLTIDYMEDHLRDKAEGFFYGSQDADEEFYKLPAAEREGRDEPYIDHTCYTAWNALTASAFLEASWTLDRPELGEAAVAALNFAWERCREPGQGMYRFHDGSSPQVLGLLGDQVHMARALLDAHEVTGDSTHLERALELARLLQERFADGENGGFYDAWDRGDDLGRLRDREKPLQENSVAAEVFWRLHHLTRDEQYGQVAQATLEAFVGIYAQGGFFAGGYARQVDIILNQTVEVNIVGDLARAPTRALQRAALALDQPARVVQVLHPQRDAARLGALALPSEPVPAAYVCVGTTCSAPVRRAAGLPKAVRAVQKAGGSSSS